VNLAGDEQSLTGFLVVSTSVRHGILLSRRADTGAVTEMLQVQPPVEPGPGPEDRFASVERLAQSPLLRMKARRAQTESAMARTELPWSGAAGDRYLPWTR
jgi:hypothetical protein